MRDPMVDAMVDLVKRVEVLEAQVRSLQASAPRGGIPHPRPKKRARKKRG